MRIPAALVVLLLCFQVAAIAEELDVYLLAGESNMTGRAPVSELSSFVYSTTDESILYAAREIDWSNGDTRQDVPLGGLRPTNGTIGPAVSLGRNLGEDIALISFSSGGSGTYNWSNSGNIQSHWFSYIDDQMSSLRMLGHTPTICFTLWVIGSIRQRMSPATTRPLHRLGTTSGNQNCQFMWRGYTKI